jgi:hypothetical protein
MITMGYRALIRDICRSLRRVPRLIHVKDKGCARAAVLHQIHQGDNVIRKTFDDVRTAMLVGIAAVSALLLPVGSAQAAPGLANLARR